MEIRKGGREGGRQGGREKGIGTSKVNAGKSLLLSGKSYVCYTQ